MNEQRYSNATATGARIKRARAASLSSGARTQRLCDETPRPSTSRQEYTLSHERHCAHCGHWHPADDWLEHEDIFYYGDGKAAPPIRTIECPGCRSISDAHAPQIRETPDA